MIWENFPLHQELPEKVISADTTETFERRLDNFGYTRTYCWHKVELTRVGSRCVINADDSIVT